MMGVLTCSCGGFIQFDTDSYFANLEYRGICDNCKKEHRAEMKPVDDAVWNYKGTDIEGGE